MAGKNHNPQVDAYIARSADFAQPILRKLRAVFHKACPEVEEAMKWSVPHFMYHGMLGGMAAFKNHVSFGFWRSRDLRDPKGLFTDASCSGPFAAKLRSARDLPSERVLTAYIKEAMKLNEEFAAGKRPRGRKKTARKDPKSVKAPPDLMAALKKNKRALATFEGFPYTHRKEYVEWVAGAKQEATRRRRVATAVQWMAEGKPQNWKYMK